jgi:hypothetical protein
LTLKGTDSQYCTDVLDFSEQWGVSNMDFFSASFQQSHSEKKVTFQQITCQKKGGETGRFQQTHSAKMEGGVHV